MFSFYQLPGYVYQDAQQFAQQHTISITPNVILEEKYITKFTLGDKNMIEEKEKEEIKKHEEGHR